jgi:hypothetical protein
VQMTFEEVEQQIKTLFDNIKRLPDPLDRAEARVLLCGYVLFLSAEDQGGDELLKTAVQKPGPMVKIHNNQEDLQTEQAEVKNEDDTGTQRLGRLSQLAEDQP